MCKYFVSNICFVSKSFPGISRDGKVHIFREPRSLTFICSKCEPRSLTFVNFLGLKNMSHVHSRSLMFMRHCENTMWKCNFYTLYKLYFHKNHNYRVKIFLTSYIWYSFKGFISHFYEKVCQNCEFLGL